MKQVTYNYQTNKEMGLTTDPNDPDINIPEGPGQQNKTYIVLPEEERAKGFVRPVRQSYRHKICGITTTMGLTIAETYARNPKFYSATWCCGCQRHLPVSEFNWIEEGKLTDQVLGS